MELSQNTLIILLGGIFLIGPWLLIAAWFRPVVLVGLHAIGRVILDSLPFITYLPLAAGFSPMQAYTGFFLVVAAALLTAKRAFFATPLTTPIVAMSVVYLFSAGLSQEWMGAADGVLRLLYLYLWSRLVAAAIHFDSERTVLLTLWLCLIYPLLNQAKSIIMNTPSFGAGQFSFIGSYGHESDLTFLIYGFIVTSFALALSYRKTIVRAVFYGALMYGHVALFLCNYRTTFAALAVFWIAIVWKFWFRFKAVEKMLLIFAIFAVTLAGIILLGETIAERMGDIVKFIVAPGDYLDFSGHAKRAGLMSGRIDLINIYMYNFLSASPEHWILGLGPRSGNTTIGIYAHNEFISALVETGILGILAFVALLFSIVKIARRAAEESHLVGITLGCGIIGLLMMTLGTMPFRDMRSLLILGALIGCAECYSRRTMTYRKSSRKITANTSTLLQEAFAPRPAYRKSADIH
jgi:hypothetical protein